MWHAKKIEEVLNNLNTDPKNGLTEDEVNNRLKKYKKNIIPEGRNKRWYTFLFRQFKSPLVYILLAGLVITIFLNEWTDAIVISLAVGINIAVGFWQEYKSNNILDELKKIVKVKALVTRDGYLHEIDSRDLVPGDIIHLKAGLKVPADARIIESHNLYVDQSALTGESTPVQKYAHIEKSDTPLPDRGNMVYMGTIVTGGNCKAVVVGTGETTEIGKIALLAQKTYDEETPLQKRMSALGKIIAYTVITLSVMIFIIGMLRSIDIGDMLITTIAVAVAGVPEGLPAAISIILAVSAQRILKKNGVIKKLVAAETLGSATVICTDKTGTLTKGKMEVQDIVFNKDATKLQESLLFANSASLKKIGDKYVPIGEPTDVAKFEYVLKHNKELAFNSAYRKLGFMEFNSKSKIIGSIYELNGEIFIYINGAPEEVLNRSNLKKQEKEDLIKKYEEMAEKGFRVIAVGHKKIDAIQNIKDGEVAPKEIDKLANNIIFNGFVIIEDPIREDVKKSIETANNAGIKTIIVTGDHQLTARSVAHKLGIIKDKANIIEGKDLDLMSDEQISAIVEDVDIYARVTPEHKVKIISALKKNGEVVAMTGDGINDSPALIGADIGIAVGSGTDIAKEAADLVLLNDSFSTIVLAIEQGRIAFDNIKKVSVLLLTSSFSEIILIMSGLLIPLFSNSFELLPLPITALQILYVNLAEDTLPNISLAFEPGEKDVMKRPPIKKNAPILDSEAKMIILIAGIIIDIVLVIVFLRMFIDGEPTRLIQTTIFAAISIDTFFYVFSIKSLRAPIWKTKLFNNKYLIIALLIEIVVILLAIYHPLFNNLLGTEPLSLSLMMLVIALSVSKMTFIEIIKSIYRRHAT